MKAHESTDPPRDWTKVSKTERKRISQAVLFLLLTPYPFVVGFGCLESYLSSIPVIKGELAVKDVMIALAASALVAAPVLLVLAIQGWRRVVGPYRAAIKDRLRR